MLTIQFAVLGKSEDVKLFGFDRFPAPLLRDIFVLEKEGIYVEAKCHNVKGTIFVFVQIIWQHMDWLAFKKVFL